MKKFILVACFFCSWSLSEPVEAALTYPQHYETPIQQVKSATLPVKQGHSNSAKTVKTFIRNEAVYTTSTVIAGWRQLATNSSFYVNQSMLTAPIGYGKLLAQETTIFKLTADHVVKGGGNVVVSTMKKGDLVAGTFAQPTAVQSLHLQPSTGSVDARYLQIISPTIRQVHVKTGVVLRERPSPSAKIITTLPHKLALRSYGQILGGWRVVKYGETIGYVAAHTIDAAKPTTRFIAADGLPVYEKASRTANVQFVLAQGTAVTAYEGIGGWSYIYLGDVSGYVPTQLLTTKQSTPLNSTKQNGLKMDVRAVQPHITNTKTITQNGKTFYVHTVRNVLGIQQAGSQTVYLKPFTSNATNEALTQQLTKDTGTSFIACDRTICLLKEGELIPAISLPHTSRSIDYFAMKRITKGEIQVAYTDIEYDGEYKNITYSFLNYRFDAKQQTFIQTHEQTMLDGNGSHLLTRWQSEAGFVVK